MLESRQVLFPGAPSVAKQRVRVSIDDALTGETLTALEAARGIARSGRISAPLVDSPKCPRCSLVGICLPEETRHAMGLDVFLRMAQVRRGDDPAFALGIARDIVATKIRNQRTLLQRNHVEPSRLVLARLKQLATESERVSSTPSLLGIEGNAARLYFEQFPGMLKPAEEDELPAFEFEHRSRRPPRDPVNALLSFAYSLLTKDLTIVCHAVGFDPFVGFYHPR